MSNINKQALRQKSESASAGEWVKESGAGWHAVCSSDDQANSGFIVAHFEGPDSNANREFVQAANPATVLALLDELEAAEKYAKDRDSENEGLMLTVGRLRVEKEAAEKRIAEQRELLQWAHDTLLEINPNNYTHDDVCEINSASVEVILGIAPVLGEAHGKSEEWWAARAAGIRINGED